MRRVAHADTSKGARLADLPVPTLLIVEDEPSIAHALARLFAREGYRLSGGARGQWPRGVGGLPAAGVHPHFV
jgi:hypothetical protein